MQENEGLSATLEISKYFPHNHKTRGNKQIKNTAMMYAGERAIFSLKALSNPMGISSSVLACREGGRDWVVEGAEVGGLEGEVDGMFFGESEGGKDGESLGDVEGEIDGV